MCGISGVFSQVRPINIQQYCLAHSLLRHRGPDDEGFVAGEGAVGTSFRGNASVGKSRNFPHILSCHDTLKWIIGHHRLSIIDLSDKGHQPMASPDHRHWLAYNGEVYNYRELRGKLENLGYHFQTRTDTEVVLFALLEWGIGAFSRFNGMWALAWYDTQTGNLILSRDRFGIKPLYYALNSNVFYFGSEAKFFRPLIKLTMNEKTALAYLAFCYLDHSSESFYNEVNSLPPATYASYNATNGSISQHVYWTLKDVHKDVFITQDEAARQFEEIFESSINLRMRSDVPVGTLLSGGLDSSSIVCNLRKTASAEDEELHFFSAVFHEKEFSEKQYVTKIEKAYQGLRPHYVYPKPGDLLKHLDSLCYTQDFPFRSLAVFSQNKLYQEVRQSSAVAVLLNGQGGDELFGGYTAHYYSLMLSYLFSLRFSSFMRELHSFSQNRSKSSRHVLSSLLKLSMIHVFRTLFSARLTTGPCGVFKRARMVRAPVFSWDPFESNLKENLHYSALPEYLRYEDRNSMAYSLESRLPFLDYRLVEWAFSLPAKLKIAGSKDKAVIRDAVSSYVPADIVNRRDKMGFVSPQEIWQKQQLKPLLDEAVANIVLPSLNRKKLKEYYGSYENNRDKNWPFWWRIASLYHWMNTLL